jgi:hypothetical protein
VAKYHPPRSNSYSFIASTSRSIENHLATHRIRRNGIAKTESTSSNGQTAISRYLQYDLDNPHHKQLIEQLMGLYDQKVSNLRLINWIVNHNLPFRLVATPDFRLFINSINPGVKIPSKGTILSLLNNKYKKVVPEMRRKLQTAMGMIHLTFDGWTSRQNTSFLGVSARFLDKDWNHQTVLLGLPPLARHHTGQAIHEEAKRMLEFFGVEER